MRSWPCVLRTQGFSNGVPPGSKDGKSIGLPADDAAQVIVNGVEDGMWWILVGDDAVAIDKGIRSMELGDMYPLEDRQEPNDAFNDDWLARNFSVCRQSWMGCWVKLVLARAP